MKYLHIKNLEEYNPGYQDRSLIWCKVYFKMINADHDFEMLCEIDKWRFIAFVMLELQTKKPVSLDESYLVRKGFDFKIRKLSDTLDKLSQSIEITGVTEETQERNESVTQSRVEYSRKEKSRIEEHTLENVKNYFKEKGTHIDPESFWNYYEARNWKGIVNWKSCLVTWEKRDKPKMFDGKPLVKHVEETPKRKAPDPKQQEEVAMLIRSTALNLDKIL